MFEHSQVKSDKSSVTFIANIALDILQIFREKNDSNIRIKKMKLCGTTNNFMPEITIKLLMVEVYTGIKSNIGA